MRRLGLHFRDSGCGDTERHRGELGGEENSGEGRERGRGGAAGGVMYCGWALRARCDGGQGGGGGGRVGGGGGEGDWTVGCTLESLQSSHNYFLHLPSSPRVILYPVQNISFLLAFAVKACDACPWNQCSSLCRTMARSKSCTLRNSLIKLIRWHTHARTKHKLSLSEAA